MGLNSKIYIVTHKETNLPEMKDYIPLVVGNHSVKYSDAVYDNTLDNIAEKNPNYCELTGLYWIWKNDKYSDYIGFCHYRRYFRMVKKLKNLIKPELITSQEISALMDKYDIILPYPITGLKTKASDLYIRTGGKEKDVSSLREIIGEKYPEYLKDYDGVWNDGSLSYFNMMILSRKLLDEYCKWLFDILFELEKRTDLTGYSKWESRIYGFLSERLLNVWVRNKGLKVKYMHIYETESSQNNITVLKNILRYNLYRLYGKR